MTNGSNEILSWQQRLSRFTKRNLVMIVMIPAMVSIHWGWSKLQNVEVFVPKEDRRELPIIEGIKVLSNKISSTDKPATVEEGK